MNDRIIIRAGVKKDVPQMFELIRELAIYEKAEEEIVIGPAQLEKDGFGPRPLFLSLVAEVGEEIVGLAIFFDYYSTWKGKNLYLQDLIVKENSRRKGIGALLIKEVAAHALKNDCHGVLWQVLHWNTTAKEFYKKIGATINEEWANCAWQKTEMLSWLHQEL